MTWSVGKICAEALEQWDIVRIFAEPFARDLSSRRVLEKNGFRLEGIKKKASIKRGSFWTPVCMPWSSGKMEKDKKSPECCGIGETMPLFLRGAAGTQGKFARGCRKEMRRRGENRRKCRCISSAKAQIYERICIRAGNGKGLSDSCGRG